VKLNSFNQLSHQQAFDLLMQCNTSENWCHKMAEARPFSHSDHLLKMADTFWQASTSSDLLAAFDGHPEIGDVSTLREKYQNTGQSARHEQSGVDSANEEILQALANGNKDYKNKFGFIFIICASGKSAQEMLLNLQKRVANTRQQELANAAGEQRKITQIRLKKMLADGGKTNEPN